MGTTIKKLSQGYGYRYTELSTIHEELEKQGITYYQYTEYCTEADADYIYTVLIYDGEEKPARRGCRVIYDGGGKMGVAQQQGSGVTYCRRYSLLMALGWATEDDDGASVGAGASPIRAPKPAPKYDSRLDFDQVKARLEQLKTTEEVEAARDKLFDKYPKMTDKQRSAINRMFADRIDHIEYGDNPFNLKDAKEVK